MPIAEKQILWIPKRQKLELVEHYVNFPTASSAYGGQLNLQVVQTGSLSIAGSDATHPGVARHSTSTTSTGRCALNTNLNAFLLGGAAYEIEYGFKISTALSDGTNSYSFWLGFSDSSSGLPANGAGLYYSQATGSNLLYYCTKASAATSAIAIAADLNWHIFNAKINKAGTSVVFTIDGANSQTISTNVPNTNRIGLQSFILKSAGTTARTLDVDYTYLKIDFT